MKAVIIKVSLSLLNCLLRLDPKFKLSRVRQSWEQEGREFELLVECDEFPEVREFDVIPIATVTIFNDGTPSEIK